MCGIAGFSLTPQSTVNVRLLTHHLLAECDIRGRQASGWAAQTQGGFIYHKAPIAGTKQSVRKMPRRTRQAIIHTRQSTTGPVAVNANNHPVLSVDREVALVHNGHVANHKTVRNALAKGADLPEVDTAVLPQIIAEIGTDGFAQLMGDVATLWLDRREPGILNVARVSNNPLVTVRLADGSLVFGSTESIVTRALDAVGEIGYNVIGEQNDETLIKVRDGKMIEVIELPSTTPRVGQAHWRGTTEGKPPVGGMRRPAYSSPVEAPKRGLTALQQSSLPLSGGWFGSDDNEADEFRHDDAPSVGQLRHDLGIRYYRTMVESVHGDNKVVDYLVTTETSYSMSSMLEDLMMGYFDYTSDSAGTTPRIGDFGHVLSNGEHVSWVIQKNLIEALIDRPIRGRYDTIDSSMVGEIADDIADADFSRALANTHKGSQFV